MTHLPVLVDPSHATGRRSLVAPMARAAVAAGADGLLIEVHPPLQEDASTPPSLTDLTRLLVEATREEPLPIDWIGAERIWREARGIPLPVAAQPPRTAALPLVP